MSSETGECNARDGKSDEECDCVDYTESSDIPGYCGECYHPRKDHLTARPGASKKPSAVTSLLAGLMSGKASKAGPSSSRSRASSSSHGLSTKRKSQGLLGAANREANRGMRPPPDDEGKSKKGKAKEAAKRDRDTFKVISCQLLPCGTVFKRLKGSSGREDQLVRIIPEQFQSIPDKYETQMAELDGLAVVRTKGIVFDRDADHEEVVETLTNVLPLPFAYFARAQREAGDDDPLWFLAAISKKKLVIVPSDRPDGSVLDLNKGHGTTGFRNDRLFLVSRDPIPPEILNEWVSESKSTSSSFRRPRTADDEDILMSDASLSVDSDEDESSPESIPVKKNKRRLVSRSSDEEDEVEKQSKKRQKTGTKWSREPEILNDEIAHEIMGKELIDLTSGDEVHTRASTPDFLRAIPKSPPAAPPSPGRPEEFDDSDLGNPYDSNVKFDFKW